jgi:hypothetical protein
MSRTVKLYTFDELTNPDARKRALQWMREMVASDLDTSDFAAVIRAVRALTTDQLVAIAPRFAECPLTGFFADHDALEAVHTMTEGEGPDVHAVALAALDRCMEKDRDFRLSDEACTEDLQANEYTFTAKGERIDADA